MIFNTVSMKKPDATSIGCYTKFYNIYSFIQMNNLLMHFMSESLKDYPPIHEFLQNIGKVIEEEYETLSINLTTMMIDSECFSERLNEKRGINTELENITSKLTAQTNKEVFSFFFDVQEFLFLYSLFEDSIKGYLQRRLREKEIVEKLLEHLNSCGKKAEFIDHLAIKSCNIIEIDSDIELLWEYYTQLRHLYAHSMGIVTQHFHDSVCGIRSKFDNFIEKKSFSIPNAISSAQDGRLIINFDFIVGQLYILSSWQLNLFRNFIIFTMECLVEIER